MYRRLAKQLQNYKEVKPNFITLCNGIFQRRYGDVCDSEKTEGKCRVQFDYNYLCDPKNLAHIEKLIFLRKGVGDIRKVIELYDKLQCTQTDAEERRRVESELEKEAAKIPNQASPHLFSYGEEPKLIEFVNEKPKFDFKPKEIYELGKEMDVLRTDNLGLVIGPRSYYLRGAFAELEQALIRYTVSYLVRQGFVLMSVPDLLYSDIIESCGMNTKGEHTQVYRIDGLENDVCLSGTAEMSIAGYLRNREYSLKDLPLKMAAVSRCFRAESSTLQEERGIYRVHGFTKVEMFGVTEGTGRESDELYSTIIQIQKELFSQLGIHFQVLDMPLSDLGAPAYSKVDIEAYMPGRKAYGEISSASNCIDYQSRRLNILYRDSKGMQRFVHTVNGTACALPRMIIALCETFQSKDGSITIPPVLRPYMSGLERIEYNCHKPCSMTWMKRKTYMGNIV